VPNKNLKISSDPNLIEPGNIDLTKRPKVRNADGSYSTVRSIGITVDGGNVMNIPTVVDGKVVSNEEAVKYARRTKQHLGIYRDQRSADRAAMQLHKDQEQMYGK
jgi:hypothetical protein